MANPPMPWKVEYAKSARSSCRTCKNNIGEEVFRLGKMVQSSQFDVFMPMWNHANCVLKKANQIKSLDDVEWLESLRWEDQQKIRKYVEGGGPSNKIAVSTMEYGIEVSQSSRATRKDCNQKIMKGEVRVSSKPSGQGARGLAWNHANCLLRVTPSIQVEKLFGWDSLSVSDQVTVCAMVKKVPSTAKGGTTTEEQQDKDMPQQSTSKDGRKCKNVGVDQRSKVAKAEGDVSTGKASSVKNSNNRLDEQISDLESKLEAQSKELWALKDDLKKHVTTKELKDLLDINDQESRGSELDLCDRCADGMMFGALGRCPLCSGSLRYSGSMYRCCGYQSAWSKCSYSTCEPECLEGKWKVPEGTDNEYLSKWFKTQKSTKPVRVLPPLTSNNPSAIQATNTTSQPIRGETLGDLKVSFSRLPKESMEEWKRKIEEAGGQDRAKDQ